MTVDNKILAREVIQEKTPDGKKNLRIILKPRTLRGQKDSSSDNRSAVQPRPIRPVPPTGQTSQTSHLKKNPFAPRACEA